MGIHRPGPRLPPRRRPAPGPEPLPGRSGGCRRPSPPRSRHGKIPRRFGRTPRHSPPNPRPRPHPPRVKAVTPAMDSPPPPSEITSLLHRVRGGDPAALDRLLPLVYSELHRLAASQMRRDFANVTLQPTALVNEAFLRLFGNTAPDFHDRAHFLGIVSRVMRQVLVDYARARRAEKRGPGLQIPLDDSAISAPLPSADRLAAEDPRLVTLIEMRFFAGMTAEETADALNQSVHVVRHEIRYALAWLRRALQPAQL